MVKKRREMLGDIHKSIGHSLDQDVRLGFEVLQDNGDKSVDEHLKYINGKITDSRSGTLEQIEDALVKIEEGTYGICEECGAEIPVERLAAVFCATHCMPCQSDVDKRKKEDQLREKFTDPSEDEYEYLIEEK